MPRQGIHSGLDSIGPPPALTERSGAAEGYSPRATLGLGVELRRQLTRRRTQATLGFLVVLPFLLIAAFKLGSGSSGNPRGAPDLADLATSGAANFTVFTLFVSAGFLFVVVGALFAGDTVAREASWSSLRYLLAAPVPRGLMLWRKLVVAVGFSWFSLILLPVVAYLSGGVAFGWQGLRIPLGASLGVGESLLRIAGAVAYLGLTLLFVIALAFLIGVCTDAPLGAVGGAVLLVIVLNILDAVTALGDWRLYLPTHDNYAFTDLLTQQVSWDAMQRGVALSLGYGAVLLAFAWWHFLRKDVVS